VACTSSRTGLLVVTTGSGWLQREGALIEELRSGDVVCFCPGEKRWPAPLDIGPWTDWQGNLDAELMVVGQEWGGEKNYVMQRGRDVDDDPTNANLVDLVNSISPLASLRSRRIGNASGQWHRRAYALDSGRLQPNTNRHHR
jgi:hypothetical protein